MGLCAHFNEPLFAWNLDHNEASKDNKIVPTIQLGILRDRTSATRKSPWKYEYLLPPEFYTRVLGSWKSAESVVDRPIAQTFGSLGPGSKPIVTDFCYRAALLGKFQRRACDPVGSVSDFCLISTLSVCHDGFFKCVGSRGGGGNGVI